ncbi:cellulose biosynthesis cyclic di-GMP-binding regulatory protein BcsB [Ancylobacter sonchi]|uniref:cellulose biosynthesis cyclic di-GMP-binding regulatory protein BcsB n=1 Tax=Ancylobacter sonchi TaxID=1937790 RepID=UPI001BD1C308|nr:cellulose biosynthesis cyclic di-GMP-binding regulatory protein BcsB [Ancylobacter sonchi]MBS7535810.1 cellulose biosynthesis cyclic di-GMP-binding regulatory protein BcsB [Ancylobacter sonchi]
MRPPAARRAALRTSAGPLAAILALGVALLGGPASAQQSAAGQGTSQFQMTPPLGGGAARPAGNAAPPLSVPMTAPGAFAPGTPSAIAQMPSPADTPAQPAPAQPAPADGNAAPDAAPFQMVPGQPAPAVVAPMARQPAGPQRPDRFIIPQARMVFAGELASRAFVIYATPEEAARQATFLLSYLNAVVVMPESSRIRVSINGQAIVESPIASSQEPARISAPIPRGTLRAGANLVRIEVVQRHRTDCAVTATYELWTEINNEGTGIAYAGGRPKITGGLDDLAAVGVDVGGATNIRVITAGSIDTNAPRVLRAIQGLALRGLFPNPSVSITDGASGPAAPGTLNLVIGAAPELARLMANPMAEARQRPVANLVDDARLGAPTLVLSGPTANDVDRAIDRLNDFVLNQGDSIPTATSFAPNAPLFTGARSLRLAELGVTTQEFSGRRLRAEFQIALPADFFAEFYGNAQLLLDVAFTAAVRPGSHVDVYVNGQIASNLPITTRGGGLMQHQPMQIPLRNFRPGINQLWLEVVLDTDADTRCLPGATLPSDSRFVLFDSTEFSMENFARIGTVPNLAALTASAFPYGLEGPTAVVLARQDATTLGAAATLLARLARGHGRALALDASPSMATLGERNALFIGDIDHIPASVLDQVGISESTRSNWVVSAEDAAGADNADSYDSVLQRFRDRQSGGNGAATPATPADDNTSEVYQRWRNAVQNTGALRALADSFEGWLKRTFNISFESLRINQGQRTLYEPPPRTSILMAQGNSPNEAGVWTLVTARTADTLASGTTRLVSDASWNRIGGQAIALQSGTGEVERHDVTSHRFIVTTPLSFANIRMISANWLSTNIVPYALMLMIASLVLGIATFLLLRRMGRPS